MRTNDEFYYRAYEEFWRANCPEINVVECRELIHLIKYSCGQGTHILPMLLKFDDDIELDVIYENSTALNILAKHITSENFDDVFKSIKQFVDYGANPNIPDGQEMTPMLYIIEKEELDHEKKKIIIEYFLNLEYPKVDIDSYVSQTQNFRTLLRSKFPDIQLPLDDTRNSHFLILPKLLREKQENDFLRYFQENPLVIKIPDDINQRKNFILHLLKIAIKNGLNKALEVLLERRFFNVRKAFDIGVKTACNVGNKEALKKLLEKYNSNLKDGGNLLKKIILMLDKTNENNDYMGCFDILIDSSNINDNDRSFALDCAIQLKKEKLIANLFAKGVNLLSKSLQYINPEVLENFFDECITTNGLKHGESGFGIRINYSNFQRNSDEDQGIFSGQEIMAIKGIAESKNLKHLLSHPLITSFLFLKWHQLSAFFYSNLIFCFCFYISLISHIILDLNNANEGFKIIHLLFSIVGLIYIILREVIQWASLLRDVFATSFAYFFKNNRTSFPFIPNFIEIALIIVTILTLSNSNYQNEPQRTYAVLTILLVSAETYLLVGSLPILSFSTHMLMLNAVCVSFIKSFFQYSIFFFTFGLCFHITFRNAENSNDDTDTDADHFNSVFGSIFKTFIMVTGEFDSGNIKFNSPTSYAIFTLFVAFMAIILLNLLNGLAVSDTQMIRKEAELNDYICRTNVIVNLAKSLAVLKKIPQLNVFYNRTTSLQDYIEGDYITIQPFNDNKIKTMKMDNQLCFMFGSTNIFSCCRQSFFRLGEKSKMDATIVQAALSVIEKKQRVQEQEKSVLEQKNLLKDIKREVEEQEFRLKNIEHNYNMNCKMILQKLDQIRNIFLKDS